eukprot:scaffold220169_cov17-Prasinocladus_malaysianus.AAC.1
MFIFDCRHDCHCQSVAVAIIVAIIVINPIIPGLAVALFVVKCFLRYGLVVVAVLIVTVVDAVLAVVRVSAVAAVAMTINTNIYTATSPTMPCRQHHEHFSPDVKEMVVVVGIILGPMPRLSWLLSTKSVQIVQSVM